MLHVIAGASPDNTPAGYYWTFLFPEILFIVVVLLLWALFGRPHQRVPAQRLRLGLSASSAVGTGATATAAAPGVAPSSGPPPTASPGPSGGAEATDGGQPPADGAEAGE